MSLIPRRAAVAGVLLAGAIALALVTPGPAGAESDDDAAIETPRAYLLLQRLIDAGVIPERARLALEALVEGPPAVRDPGAVCRRILAADDPRPEWVERCEQREERATDGPARPRPAAFVCRIALDDPETHPDLAARCEHHLEQWREREWSPARPRSAPLSRERICDRIEAAESLDANLEGLVERCKRWADKQEERQEQRLERRRADPTHW